MPASIGLPRIAFHSSGVKFAFVAIVSSKFDILAGLIRPQLVSLVRGKFKRTLRALTTT